MKTTRSLLKVFLLTIITSLALTNAIYAAPMVECEIVITQPDGTELHCFVSGDEFDNYVIRIGFTTGIMVDKPFLPAAAFRFLISNNFRVADESDIVVARTEANTCTFIFSQALLFVTADICGD